MRHPFPVVAAALLCLLSFSAFAGNDCAVRGLSANDAQVGEAITVQWSIAGDVSSVTITGHDFAAPVVLPATQTSFTYVPDMPGEKHATVTASGACGTASASTKYQVKQCTIDTPMLTVDQTSVKSGDVINASVALPPGHTARWEVTNGTPSTTEGSAISITAGEPGAVTITVRVSRGSSCTVSTVAVVEVKSACDLVVPVIDMPPSVTGGSAFFAALDPTSPDLTVTWSVSGGTISFSDWLSARIIPNAAATSITVTATVSNGTCSVVAKKTVPVVPCLASATVTAAPNPTCASAQAIVTFTGTPPFRGQWSDGLSYNTSSTTLVRNFTVPGNYTLRSVTDAFCRGTVTGVASLQFARPSASYTLSCRTAHITFSGTAPFRVDAFFSTTSGQTIVETITSNEPTIDWAVPTSEDGFLGLTNMRDASCSGTVSPFFSQYVDPAPTATASSHFSCGTSEQGGWVEVSVFASNEAAPFTVTWDDGEVTTGYFPVRRFVDPSTTKTYTITGIETANCGPVALPEERSFTYMPTPQPVAMFENGIYFCPGDTTSAAIVNAIPEDAAIVWSVQNGTIVSGQGTTRIELTAGDQPGDIIATAEARYANGCVGVSDASYATGTVFGPPSATLSVEPAIIHAGETATVIMARDLSVGGFTILSSLGDEIEVVASDQQSITFLYRSTHGPGQAVITVNGFGQCGGAFEASTTLTIEP